MATHKLPPVTIKVIDKVVAITITIAIVKTITITITKELAIC